MEELLKIIIGQNEKIVSALDLIAGKLEILESISQDISSIDTAVSIIDGTPEGFDIDIKDIKSELAGVHQELQWSKKLSSAAQIIQSIDNVVTAIEQERP